jgi:hypothetical protein
MSPSGDGFSDAPGTSFGQMLIVMCPAGGGQPVCCAAALKEIPSAVTRTVNDLRIESPQLEKAETSSHIQA